MPHGGTVSVITTNLRAKAARDFILRSSDTFLIAGNRFVLGILPHPCVRVQWVQPAADQAVQGSVQIVFTQPRVSGR